MRYAILGTGMVGRALGAKLLSLGHEVKMGSRTGSGDAAAAWAGEGGERASVGTFADAASFGELALLAVKGEHALAVVEAAGSGLDGKVLVDITNPLDFSKGFPPRLFVCNDESLGERIQRAAPHAKVVKALNTIGHPIMVDPGQLDEPTDTFVAGDGAGAKATVQQLLVSFGHREPIDLGGIEASRGLEAWLLLWTRLYGALDTPLFNVKLVRKPK
jgi:8-hydroxy-5-deazaflavin:NADPH oxidoreductase